MLRHPLRALARRSLSGYARETYNAPGFADTYGDFAKSSPWRIYGERWLLSKLMGSLHGKRVLDCACGDGINARWLHALGAREIVGVDVSEEMVRIARERTPSELPITYVVGDAAEVGSSVLVGETFDVVLANYLLNYAKTARELEALLCGLRKALPLTSGLLVAANDYSVPISEPHGVVEAHGVIDLRRFGIQKTMRAEDVGVEGAPVLIEVFHPEPPHADWPASPGVAVGDKLLEFYNYYVVLPAGRGVRPRVRRRGLRGSRGAAPPQLDGRHLSRGARKVPRGLVGRRAGCTWGECILCRACLILYLDRGRNRNIVMCTCATVDGCPVTAYPYVHSTILQCVQYNRILPSIHLRARLYIGSFPCTIMSV